MSAATVLPAAEAYRRLAPTYDATANPLICLEQRTLTAMLPPLVGRTVVDVGAGTGRWARVSNDLGGRTISIDFSAAMLQRAPSPAIVGDANRLPLPNQFSDLVICAFTLGYAPGCLPELARIVRSGGTVIVSDVHPDRLKAGWKRSFRSGDEVIEIENAGYDIADLECPSLRLERLLLPHFGEPERAIFAASGKAGSLAEMSRQPAIFIAQWIRE